MISPLGFFWLFLAVAFFAMGMYTNRMKQIVMPKLFKEAHEREYFAGADIDKLRPIFDHMLVMESIAFVLTGISALVEFVIR